TFESVQQIFNTESIPSISNLSSLSNLSSESNLSSISSQSSTSNLSCSIQKNQNIVEPIRDQRKDGQSLSSKLLSENEWNELEELITLLAPFAQITELIGGSHYPTLSMMLPTISCLFTHLNQMKASLISPNILDICHQIENSMFTRWEDPLIECYILSYLDPRFKNMNFISKKKKENVQNKLSEIVEIATNTIDTLVQTEMDHFYNGEIRIEHLIDDELEHYEK
ncbi:11422_t:CDS:2, partial [Gigaspora margarita]